MYTSECEGENRQPTTPLLPTHFPTPLPHPLFSPPTGIDGLDDSGPPDYPEVDDDPATRRGLDRLRTHGFTIAEVAALRSYFTPRVGFYSMYMCICIYMSELPTSAIQFFG